MRYLRSYNESKHLEIEGYDYVDVNTYIHKSGLFELLFDGYLHGKNSASFRSIECYNGFSIFQNFYKNVKNINEITTEFYNFINKYYSRIQEIYGTYEDFILPLIDIGCYLVFDLERNGIDILTIEGDLVSDIISKYPSVYKQMSERLLDIGIKVSKGDRDVYLFLEEI